MHIHLKSRLGPHAKGHTKGRYGTPPKSILLFALALLTAWPLLFPSVARADWMDDVGYTQLQAAVGSGLPDGTGVPVTEVEAAVYIDHDEDPLTEDIPVWMPNPNNGQFTGKTINDMSGNPDGFYSGHATAVGKKFFGNTASMTPGITTIDSYLADHWLDYGFLNGGIGNPQPAFSSSRVANHSYIGYTDDPAVGSNLLRRLDWVIDRDEYIQTVGMGNSTNRPLLGSSFNAIAVGRSDGNQAQGSVHLDDDYSSGRARPDVVAPFQYTSTATPVIGSAASLLVETGHDDPSLSTDPVSTSTTNRNNDTIYNAERSEVVKAALMAGADRVTQNTSYTDISGYRSDPAHQTDNGLDIRYGAGQLNIYNSYRIITGGEQNSAEDVPGNLGDIGWFGFDYDPAFGGSNGANTTGSYYFTTNDVHTMLYASLVWNIEIDGGTGSSFDGSASLYDLDLFLYDMTDPGDPFLMDSSTSLVDNTENLWLALVGGTDYLLQVGIGAGQAPFQWDYALAWQITAPVPLPPTLILLGSGLAVLFGIKRKVRKRDIC